MYRDYPPRMGVDTPYFSLCKKHFQRLKQLEEQIESLKQHQNDYQDDPEYWEARWEADECITIVIVFAALCLEAFIYDYGAVHTSDSFMDNYVDKLNPVAKWVIVIKVVTGKDFPTDSQAFELLKRLMKERNSMVHFKSYDVPFDDEKRLSEIIHAGHEVPNRAAHDAFKAVGLVMKELQKIDPGFGKIHFFIEDTDA